MECTYAQAYTPTLSRSWYEYLEEAKACEPELTEDACEAIAAGFSELGWDPNPEEISEFRKDFITAWREALIGHWKASSRTLETFVRILKGPEKGRLIRSMLRSITDEIRKEQREEPMLDAPAQGRGRHMQVPRVNIPLVEGIWKDYARCHINVNLTKINGATIEELRAAIRDSGLKDLLRTSAVMVEKFTEHFTGLTEPGAHLNDLPHREDWTEFQSKAQELREMAQDVQSKDLVEMLCETQVGMEELHAAAMETQIAAAIYFGHFEARYMIGWHATATGKCKGYTIARLRDSLKQLEDPTARMMAAGQLIAALGTNKKRNKLRIMEELTLWSATKIPALMTPFTYELMHKQLGHRQPGQTSKTGTGTPLLPPINQYASPPATATIYGQIDAPLAGILDKTTSLEDQMNAVDRDWETRPCRNGIAAINACTALILTLNELPALRNKEHTLNCYRIPRNQKKFLTQSLFTGAPEYVDSADRAGDHELEPMEARHEIEKEAERLIREGKGAQAREYSRWVVNEWDGTAGTHVCGVCHKSVLVGRQARLIGLRAHLWSCHTTTEQRPEMTNQELMEHRERNRASTRTYEIINNGPKTKHGRDKEKRIRHPSPERQDTNRTARSRSTRGDDDPRDGRSRKDRYLKVHGLRMDQNRRDYDRY